jgi:hypothetical protein
VGWVVRVGPHGSHVEIGAAADRIGFVDRLAGPAREEGK